MAPMGAGASGFQNGRHAVVLLCWPSCARLQTEPTDTNPDWYLERNQNPNLDLPLLPRLLSPPPQTAPPWRLLRPASSASSTYPPPLWVAALVMAEVNGLACGLRPTDVAALLLALVGDGGGWEGGGQLVALVCAIGGGTGGSWLLVGV